MQNPHFGSKIKLPKNMSKSILQIIYSCSVQKTAPKNTKYSRNESIFVLQSSYIERKIHGESGDMEFFFLSSTRYLSSERSDFSHLASHVEM